MCAKRLVGHDSDQRLFRWLASPIHKTLGVWNNRNFPTIIFKTFLIRCFSTSKLIHEAKSQENNFSSSHHHSNHHNKSYTVAKPPEPPKIVHEEQITLSFSDPQPSTTNLTKYNLGNRSSRIQHHIQTENNETQHDTKPTNEALAESARLLLLKNAEDAINVIKTSCELGSDGRINIIHLLSQEGGVEVLWRLHQAYSEIGNFEEMKNIYLTVEAQKNIDVFIKNRFKGEFVNLYSKSGNFKAAFHVLDGLPISSKWIQLFINASQQILQKNVGEVHHVIKYLSQLINHRMDEINKKIINPDHLLKPDLNTQNKEVGKTTTSQQVHDHISRSEPLENSLRKIRIFFETFGAKSHLSRFALMIAEAYSFLDEHANIETIFNHLLDSKKENVKHTYATTINLRKLKTLAMQSLIWQQRHQDAITLFFDKTIPSDNGSFEQLMKAFIDLGQMDFAIYLYKKYITNPTVGIFSELVKAYVLKGSLQKAEEIMREFLEATFIPQHRKVAFQTLLLKAYAENHLIYQAQKLFDTITQPDNRCYNELMKAYCNIGDSVKAREIFKVIPEKDTVSYLYLLESYLLDSDSRSALKAYEHIPQPTSSHADIVIRTILRDENYGGLEQAIQFFNTLEQPVLSTQKHILRALAKFGSEKEVYEFLEAIPNPDMECLSCLLLHIFKSGSPDIEAAKKVFDMIPHPDGICYGYMICIYGRIGDLEMVNQLLHQFPSTFTMQGYFYAYIANDETKQLLEEYPQLLAKYPRCFSTNDVYVSAIMEAIRSRNGEAALELFFIYMEHARTKLARDLASLLEFICHEGSIEKYKRLQPLIQKIVEALPKCVSTPNVRDKIDKLVTDIKEVLETDV
ncbi:hypothetical protein C9374_004413 [Naegleria lovaniensis]|uniref:Uncharacterized protein n=1 Tax=Naegleria lovaniensis TaxID=51637 RepID=A0AA88KFJ7_NAELO|nr:uncharacterized protein C9374_011215 [Naegleria lovaniensis]XP_044548755.1 uncharacterized protein C9374_004413 [Naegleria lovaniensis]KAG2374136.1 hypothetical protein C9374_011215 [Naegleria lovaniensis]KAG2383076.1 hypothetical protein C9374_004413 [Naegleria lovaniensis]